MITTISFAEIGNIFIAGIGTGAILTLVVLVSIASNIKKR